MTIFKKKRKENKKTLKAQKYQKQKNRYGKNIIEEKKKVPKIKSPPLSSTSEGVLGANQSAMRPGEQEESDTGK